MSRSILKVLISINYNIVMLQLYLWEACYLCFTYAHILIIILVKWTIRILLHCKLINDNIRLCHKLNYKIWSRSRFYVDGKIKRGANSMQSMVTMSFNMTESVWVCVHACVHSNIYNVHTVVGKVYAGNMLLLSSGSQPNQHHTACMVTSGV